jgi:rhodanese-related sulfurtransferase
MAAHISRTELEGLVGSPNLKLVEALPESYYNTGHLPGALNLPHEEVDALAPALLPDKTAPIVVYCASHTCQNSDIAANRLVKLGYTNVRTYHEGKQDWLEAGLPLENEVKVG